MFPKQTVIYGTTWNGNVNKWSLSTGECLNAVRYADHGYKIEHVSPTLLACSVAADDEINFIDTETLNTIDAISGVELISITSSSTIATRTSTKKCIQVINWNTKQILKEFVHTQDICAIYSLGDNLLATGSIMGEINIWNIITGECVCTFLLHTFGVYSFLLFQPGILMSGSSDTQIIIWDLNRKASIGKLLGHEFRVTELLKISSSEIASASNDKTVRVWKIKPGNEEWKGECMHVFKHDMLVTDLCWISKNVFASSSWDKTIRVWDASSGKCLQVVQCASAVIAISLRYGQTDNIFFCTSFVATLGKSRFADTVILVK